MKAAAAPTAWPLPAIGLLLGATLIAVATARMAGVDAAQVDESPAVTERLLRFEDRTDGGIAIRDAKSGGVIDAVAPGTNGFLRSAMRGLVRERKRQGVGDALPFRLTATADGRLLLEDPGTGRRIDLQSFGPANAGPFVRLLGSSDHSGDQHEH